MAGQKVYPIPSLLDRKEQKELGKRLHFLRSCTVHVRKPQKIDAEMQGRHQQAVERYFSLVARYRAMTGENQSAVTVPIEFFETPLPSYEVEDVAGIFRMDPAILSEMELGVFRPEGFTVTHLLGHDKYQTIIHYLAQLYSVGEDTIYHDSLDALKERYRPFLLPWELLPFVKVHGNLEGMLWPRASHDLDMRDMRRWVESIQRA